MAASNANTSAVDQDTVETLQSAALEGFGEAGVENVDVVIANDHTGEPAIMVQVKHHLVPKPLSLKLIFEGDRAVRDAAWQKGERRFVYIVHQYDEKQEVTAGQ
ncbi:MAG TPA: hypothetical protein VGW34_15880 [Allosphingosinicella sp.]|nr:hypothetical protein [Allosphingosinicella sp.]